MHVQLKRVTALCDVPEEGTAILLNLTKIENGVAVALDIRRSDGTKVTTKRLLERGPRSEKSAIRLAKDLATITNTRSVYVINHHDEPEKWSRA